MNILKLTQQQLNELHEESMSKILDNAKYQKCSLVAAKAKELGISLLYLPSYSPNFN